MTDRRISQEGEENTVTIYMEPINIKKSLKEYFVEIDEKRLPLAWTHEQKFSVVMVELEKRLDEIDKRLDEICKKLGIEDGKKG